MEQVKGPLQMEESASEKAEQNHDQVKQMATNEEDQ